MAATAHTVQLRIAQVEAHATHHPAGQATRQCCRTIVVQVHLLALSLCVGESCEDGRQTEAESQLVHLCLLSCGSPEHTILLLLFRALTMKRVATRLRRGAAVRLRRLRVVCARLCEAEAEEGWTRQDCMLCSDVVCGEGVCEEGLRSR